MKFKKKPIVIEAVQFTGNDDECLKFCPIAIDPEDNKPSLIIPTLEGDMLCGVGDWIIKGINGEFYPCKNDIFLKTYDGVEEEPQKEKCADCGDQLKEKEAFVLLVCKECWNLRFHQSCLRGS